MTTILRVVAIEVDDDVVRDEDLIAEIVSESLKDQGPIKSATVRYKDPPSGRSDIYQGSAYYEGEELGRADGFTSVGGLLEKNDVGVQISCFAADQGPENSPMSVTVTITPGEAEEFAQYTLAIAEGERNGWWEDEDE